MQEGAQPKVGYRGPSRVNGLRYKMTAVLSRVPEPKERGEEGILIAVGQLWGHEMRYLQATE